MKRATIGLALAIAAGFAAACGSSGSDSQFKPDPNGDGTGDGTTAGVGGGDLGGGLNLDADGGTVGNGLTLRIDPPTVTVRATGSLSAVTGTAQLQAFVSNSSTPQAARWSLDDASVGSIGQDGVFSAGKVAGKTKVYAQVGNLQATAEVTVQLELSEDLTAALPDTSKRLTDADKTALRSGGGAAGSKDTLFKWRYPYDGTVFPRGLPAPKLQFGGGAAKGAYVKVTCNNVSYEGFYPGWTGATGGAGAPRVTVNEDWWSMVTRSAGPGDKVEVLVRKIDAAGVVTEAGKETWTVAQGNLKGTILYNSYNSKLAGGIGAILSLKPGQGLKVFAKQAKDKLSAGGATNGCIVCHSVSANGKRVVAGVDWDDDSANQGGNPIYSGSFAVNASGAAVQERDLDAEGRQLPFGGLTPDGKWLVGQGNARDDWSPVRGLRQKFRSRLYNADTGAQVASTFFDGAERYVYTPAFSPDGKWLAFSQYGAGADVTGTDPRVLSIMPVTPGSGATAPTFGAVAALFTAAGNTALSQVAGWPTFTPDSKAVLFHQGQSFDTGAHGGAGDALLGKRVAQIHWVDPATKKAARLDKLNGFVGAACSLRDSAAGANDFAGPADEECQMNYEPTVLPAAVGGYYWVVFTSRRALGNTIYKGKHSLTPTGDEAFDNPQYEVNGEPLNKGYRKKLWVAAIDISGTPGADISHPAFYLEGQEAEAGNMRGFWALDPCKSDGAGCETGDECCGGFCRQVSDASGNTVKQCVAPPTGCSNDSEKCVVDADCCAVTSGTQCVNGFCALPTPVK